MNEQETISIILACLGPLLTLLVYEWKCGRETRKILTQMQVLFYNNEILKKLMIHITMDDPVKATDERAQLEMRIKKIEEILTLLASKGRLEKILDTKIGLLGDN